MTNIAVFASGSGSNAENIVNYFAKNTEIRVSMILTNKQDAYVITRAEKLGVPCRVFSRSELMSDEGVLQLLQEKGIDYIVLAGFLLLVPPNIISAYCGKIVNIHPALLPNYGGKGMYGDNVHRAVKEAGETESGITIHHVNEHFDSGDIIFQAKCTVTENDTSDDIANKVHALEYEHFPSVIEKHILNLKY